MSQPEKAEKITDEDYLNSELARQERESEDEYQQKLLHLWDHHMDEHAKRGEVT